MSDLHATLTLPALGNAAGMRVTETFAVPLRLREPYRKVGLPIG